MQRTLCRCWLYFVLLCFVLIFPSAGDSPDEFTSTASAMLMDEHYSVYHTIQEPNVPPEAEMDSQNGNRQANEAILETPDDSPCTIESSTHLATSVPSEQLHTAFYQQFDSEKETSDAITEITDTQSQATSIVESTDVGAKQDALQAAETHIGDVTDITSGTPEELPEDIETIDEFTCQTVPVRQKPNASRKIIPLNEWKEEVLSLIEANTNNVPLSAASSSPIAPPHSSDTPSPSSQEPPQHNDSINSPSSLRINYSANDSRSHDSASSSSASANHTHSSAHSATVTQQPAERHSGRPIKKPPQLGSRYNYASIDCGAKIIAANPEATATSAILRDERDRYLLNPCRAASQWFSVELCEEIALDAFQIGNMEFFSSNFRDFQVYGARGPTPPPSYAHSLNGWELLGNFTAEDRRELQYFELTDAATSPRWVRYVHVRILSHHGNRFYCPVSELRIYGRTEFEELKHELESIERALETDVAELDRLAPELLRDVVAMETVVDNNAVMVGSRLGEGMAGNVQHGEEGVEGSDIMVQVAVDIDNVVSALGNTAHLASDEWRTKSAGGDVQHIARSQGDEAPVEAIADHGGEDSGKERDTIPLVSSHGEATAQEEELESVDRERITKPSSAGVMHESVFKTLAHRIRNLELNQSLSNMYVESLSAAYTELSTTLESLRVNAIAMGKNIQSLAHSTLTARKMFEDNVAAEVARQIEPVKEQLLKELTVAKLQLIESEYARRVDATIIAIAVSTFWGIVILIWQRCRARGERQIVKHPHGAVAEAIAGNTSNGVAAAGPVESSKSPAKNRRPK